MKPIVIIGIAVGLSVIAVFGVVIAMDEIAYWQYETKMNNQQMRIVENYNRVIESCIEKFEYGNVQAKGVCEERANEQWEVWKLDEKHQDMLKSSTTFAEYEEYLDKTLGK